MYVSTARDIPAQHIGEVKVRCKPMVTKQIRRHQKRRMTPPDAHPHDRAQQKSFGRTLLRSSWTRRHIGPHPHAARDAAEAPLCFLRALMFGHVSPRCLPANMALGLHVPAQRSACPLDSRGICGRLPSVDHRRKRDALRAAPGNRSVTPPTTRRMDTDRLRDGL